MNRSDDDKKSLIVKFFNYMVSGKLWLFVSLLFGDVHYFYCLSFVYQGYMNMLMNVHVHDYYQYFHQ